LSARAAVRSGEPDPGSGRLVTGPSLGIETREQPRYLPRSHEIHEPGACEISSSARRVFTPPPTPCRG
jgi:hypothetical protein